MNRLSLDILVARREADEVLARTRPDSPEHRVAADIATGLAALWAVLTPVVPAPEPAPPTREVASA